MNDRMSARQVMDGECGRVAMLEGKAREEGVKLAYDLLSNLRRDCSLTRADAREYKSKLNALVVYDAI